MKRSLELARGQGRRYEVVVGWATVLLAVVGVVVSFIKGNVSAGFAFAALAGSAVLSQMYLRRMMHLVWAVRNIGERDDNE